MRHLEVITDIAADPQRCFDLARDVDVHLSSIPRSQERVVNRTTDGLLEQGDEVTFEARHFGVRWRLTACITDLESPVRFVDEMQSGPFSSWRHQHVFTARDGGTRMTDVADYTPPVGPLGQLVDGLLLRRYMERLLVERGQHIKAVAEGREEI